MRAAWYETLGPAKEVLRVGALAAPSFEGGEVLVRVHASGVNPSDTKKRAGWLGGALEFPRIIPHSDGAGVIEAVGPEADNSRIGERVWIYNAQFGRADGTAAEYVSLPAELAIPLPGATSFAAGACLGVPACTAHNALYWNGPVDGLTVLVQGGGGAVAGYAIQLAVAAGARVIATTSSAEKMELTRRLGADLSINYKGGDVIAEVLEATRGIGVDRIVEVDFGTNAAIDARILAPKGAIGSYSSTRRPRFEFDYYGFGYKGARVNFVQVYLLSPAERAAAVATLTTLMTADRLSHAIAGTFPLDQIAAAHDAQERPGRIGNIVVEI